MSIFNIPIENAEALGNFHFTVDLEGSVYEFRFHFNERESYWFFDMLDGSGQYIRAGVKVIINWGFLRLLADQANPPGDVLFIDTREYPSDPGLEGLGLNALLTYVEESSL